MDFIEISAKTVDDAVTEGLIKLGTTSDKIEYEVMEKGSAGFFGLGSKPAKIRIRKKSTVEDHVREFLNNVFRAMGMEVEILIRKSEDEKNIVLLSVVAGLQSKEIAKISGYSAGNVRQKLSRSLAKMKRYLD